MSARRSKPMAVRYRGERSNVVITVFSFEAIGVSGCNVRLLGRTLRAPLRRAQSPIWRPRFAFQAPSAALYSTAAISSQRSPVGVLTATSSRSEEHTSELQSRGHLVCRLLLEKKKIRG